jgi:hypothetical protein
MGLTATRGYIDVMDNNPRPNKYRDRSTRLVDYDDYHILIQAVRNTAETFGGSGRLLLNSLANELLRLHRLREKQKEDIRAAQEREWREHMKKTGEKHPDDDIPF